MSQVHGKLRRHSLPDKGRTAESRTIPLIPLGFDEPEPGAASTPPPQVSNGVRPGSALAASAVTPPAIPSAAIWFLRKEAGDVYGPVSLDELRDWAHQGRVAPADSVSQDRQSWSKAVDMPELDMNWFVDLPGGGRSGPLPLSAVLELADEEGLSRDVVVTHRVSGQSCRIEALSGAPPAKTRERSVLGLALEASKPAEPPSPPPVQVRQGIDRLRHRR